jgi:glutamine amidotransferase
MKKITIVDYGLGNIHSIVNMVEKVGGEAEIADSLKKIVNSSKLILPGVGAFDHGMKLLRDKKIIPVLKKKVIDEGIPILGICLGAQLLTKKSEEGELSGLGWIQGETKKFIFEDSLNMKVPHVGWNTIQLCKKNPLVKHLKNDSRFYFTHSYYIDIYSSENIVARTEYGLQFVSIFNENNIFGVQFHPEKSHMFGMTLMSNFLSL